MLRPKILFIALAAILLPTAAIAQQPHWYVLLEPGNDRWYRGDNGWDFHEVVTGYQDGYSVVHKTNYYNDEVFDSYDELWIIEDDGDVWHGDNCYIDMPLEEGKSWGRNWGEFNQYYTHFRYMGRNDWWAPNSIWIKETTNEGGIEVITNRFYADGIGLVHWGVSCFMCSFNLEPVVVQTEDMSWGSVKSLYRN